jgi:tRNA(Arg) A34 adenosine deaminase TadA
MHDDERWMALILEGAGRAGDEGEVPIGTAVRDGSGGSSGAGTMPR